MPACAPPRKHTCQNLMRTLLACSQTGVMSHLCACYVSVRQVPCLLNHSAASSTLS